MTKISSKEAEALSVLLYRLGKCDKHPRYRGLSKPKSTCRSCLRLYRAQQAAKVESRQ